jgi:hypothetical protein
MFLPVRTASRGRQQPSNSSTLTFAWLGRDFIHDRYLSLSGFPAALSITTAPPALNFTYGRYFIHDHS